MAITVHKLMIDNKLELVAGQKGLTTILTEDMIARPGVEFAGFFDFFDYKRVILMGSKESMFLNQQDYEISEKNVRKIYELAPPCIVFSINAKIPEMFIRFADEFGIALLKSNLRTTPTSSKLYTYLQYHLAPRISVHATLLDSSGVGTLILGKSGIGKSETPLDLIKRGHQLIADDLVEIMEKEPGNLIGTAPDILKRYMEIRGIGVVDVVTMFGAGAYRENKKIRLVIELEQWNKDKYYDRLGLDSEKVTYFNTELPKIVIPILPGRNNAVLVESAATNQKLKYLGLDGAKTLTERIGRLSRGEGNDQ